MLSPHLVTQEFRDSTCQALGVARWNQRATSSIVEKLGNTGDGRCDNRRTDSHRLFDDVRYSVAETGGGMYQHRGSRHCQLDFLEGQPPRELHGPFDFEAACEPGKWPALRAVPDEVHLYVRAASPQQRDRSEQVVKALISDESADRQKPRGRPAALKVTHLTDVEARAMEMDFRQDLSLDVRVTLLNVTAVEVTVHDDVVDVKQLRAHGPHWMSVKV